MRTGRFCGSCESPIRLTAKFCGKCGFQQRKDPSCTKSLEVQRTLHPSNSIEMPQGTDQKKVEEMGFWESLFLVLTTQPDYTANNDEQTAKDQAHQRDK